ncbi:MAG: 50S ribosomal protein L5 [Armatimonadota bacterium]|nr:50S ribosomal protein L5 [Armatimonadota bacterium]MCX7776920.1 50S ribosomal protein L5 [Armatimonadota bacterium]MDW8024753.1 50S ribosomal protein L5 [Armatimonadota bacterium]
MRGGYKPRLREKWENEVVPILMKQFGYKNVMQVPKPIKVVVNVGVGDAKDDAKHLDYAMKELAMITGQKPAVRRAKRSIAGFKLRRGQTVGCVVTLRRARMWEFLDRLINAALPRIRDFKGLPTDAFDGHGNYNLGIEEQLIFPELSYDDIGKVRGMNVTIVTSAETDEEALALLKALGMPFRNDGKR